MTLPLALGFAVGCVMALTGAGGGILAVPLLVFAVGMPVADAGPVGLLAVGIAAMLGSLFGLRHGLVRYRAALLMAVSGMVLSPVGIWLAKRIDTHWLSGLFACVLAYIAFNSYRRATDDAPLQGGSFGEQIPCIRSDGDGRFIWTAHCAKALVMAGAVAGFLSGLLGVGGGFVMVPSLLRYSDLSARSIVATSLAVTALISASGVVFSALAGAMDWPLAMPFAGGAVAGMATGHMLARRLAGSFLQKAFAAVATVVALGMLIKAISW